MRLNLRGLDIIRRFEGLKLEAYQDPVGIWTIGYGHTGPEVVKGLKVTEQEASEQLIRDINTTERQLDKALKVVLNRNQYSALVSLVFNIGIGNFQKSTLLRVLNEGDYGKAAKEITRWTYAGKSQLLGLIKRRAEEKMLFNLPDVEGVI